VCIVVKGHLQNDLYSVGRDVKPYSLTCSDLFFKIQNKGCSLLIYVVPCSLFQAMMSLFEDCEMTTTVRRVSAISVHAADLDIGITVC